MNDPTAYVDPFDEMNRAKRVVPQTHSGLQLSKREHFAGLILSGIVADHRTFNFNHQVLAKSAVEIADALINALEKNA